MGEEAEQRAKVEAEQRAKEEAEQRAKLEAEQKAKKEAEQKEREEAERKAKEAEQKAQDKAEQKSREEAERRAQDEAEMKAKEEAEQKKCVDTEPVVKEDEEQTPSSGSKPTASSKVEERTEGAETALPEAEVKSVAQAQAEVEPKPETIEDQLTASDGLGTAAAAEVPIYEAPKDDVVKEDTTATECYVVEDVKQTDEASVNDAAMKDIPQPVAGEEASKETLPSAKDADGSDVATDAQIEAQTECKETPSDKPVDKDDSTDNKMEPLAESKIAKSSIPIEEMEIKSQESDQIKADKLELGENDKINSKHTEEKDLSVATAAPVVSET